MEGWKQRPVHCVYGQVFLWGSRGFQLRITLVLTLKQNPKGKKIIEVSGNLCMKRGSISWLPVVFLFGCTELLLIYQEFSDGLIDSLYILYLADFEGLLNESLENALKIVMLTSMSYKIKCLKWKKNCRRRKITNSAAWPETYTFTVGYTRKETAKHTTTIWKM